MWAFALQPSAVEQLLDRGDFTVEEFVDEADVIQEVKSLNRRVIEYIQQPDVLKKIVELATGPPLPDDDLQRAHKLAYQAAEILQTEVLLTCIAGEQVLLDMCFSFLAAPCPVDTTRAALAAKLICSLLSCTPTEVKVLDAVILLVL